MKKLFLLLCLTSFVFGYSQENKFSRSSIKTGLGIGYNMSVKEEGLGTLSMIGYERSYGRKGRLRMNTSLLTGGFNCFSNFTHVCYFVCHNPYFLTNVWF